MQKKVLKNDGLNVFKFEEYYKHTNRSRKFNDTTTV